MPRPTFLRVLTMPQGTSLWLSLSVSMAFLLGSSPSQAGDVQGRIEMPATCSPTISPAVVSLEPLTASPAKPSSEPARIAIINQRGLQFDPRVQAIEVGQTVTFTNEDNETHNVHILTPGAPLNQSMARGQSVKYVADKPGLLRIVCDVHSHMRSFVVVSPSPYYAVCRADGLFRLNDVPVGKYRLHVWHEMGQEVVKEIEVKNSEALALGKISVEAYPVVKTGPAAPVRPWSEVIDRIGILLGESRVAVAKTGGFARARKFADDAYFEEFEGSDMETAVRRYLGYKKAGEIEGHFRGYRSLAREVSEGKSPVSKMADRSRELLLALYTAAQDLNRLGVTDRTSIDSAATVSDLEETAVDLDAQKLALNTAFASVARLADSGQVDDAASSMTSAYFDAFEPLERRLAARRPQEIRPLEARFSSIRGRIGEGLKGEELQESLASLEREVADAISRSQSGGTFGTAFFASLVTILREGVEVILLLTMLISLVAKTGQPRALAAIRLGVIGAAVASVVTALGLNLLVASAQGRAREQIEGWVLMLASGVLFYVSYWLISQTESKRWTDFLKEQVKRGVAMGGFGTLGLTAFLAVYREGAETALMYQGLIAGQAGSKLGLFGVLAGLGVGLAALTVIYRVIRTTSVKLPLRTFFKVTGFVLFGMAIVFAGNGVFELQSAGLLKVTPVTWLGTGLPLLGIHPNLQSLMVQALLFGGAVVAFMVLAQGETVPAGIRPMQSPSSEDAPRAVVSV